MIKRLRSSPTTNINIYDYNKTHFTYELGNRIKSNKELLKDHTMSVGKPLPYERRSLEAFKTYKKIEAIATN